jgi:hypothetical protein
MTPSRIDASKRTEDRRNEVEKIMISEADLERASREGVWYPLCPVCDTETPAALDAEVITCIHCDALIDIDNSF